MATIAGARVPHGAAPGREYDRAAQRTTPLWPGITTGNDARCSCTWAPRGGVMQIKVANSSCIIREHWTGGFR
jgi:hypothetical protein